MYINYVPLSHSAENTLTLEAEGLDNESPRSGIEASPMERCGLVWLHDPP